MANAGRVSNSRSILLLLLTSSFFFSALLFDYMPMIVDSQIKRVVDLATSDEIRSIWAKPPIDIHSYYWLYDVLNAEQFMAGEKIQVRKVGPFHFMSRPEKRVIEVSENKYRIVYNNTRHFTLNETSSVDTRKLDESIVIINPIYVTLVESTRELTGKLDSDTASMMISSSNKLAERFNESLFSNTTARITLLGRKVELIHKARKLVDTFGLGEDLPKLPDTDIFGFVALQNGTLSGPFEIYTGHQESMPSLGDLISYQGKKRSTEYKGKCNRIQASVGELRPMPLIEDQMLEMFVPNLCRIIHLRPTGIRKLREGTAISYIHAYEDFLSAELNPDKQCFCINGSAENYCSLSGAIELAPCSSYSPIVLTTNNIEPDPRITGSVANFSPELLASEVEYLPDSNKSAQLLILKRIGVPVKVDLTYTLFMKVIRDPHYKQVGSVPEISYIPVLMFRETLVIPPALGQILVNLENFLTLTRHMKVIMYLSTVVLLCWLTGHYYGKSSRDRVMPSSVNGANSGNNSNGPGNNFNGGGGGNDSSSERVNSADSNRSQPPTRRTSRANSLIEAMSNASGGDSNPPNAKTGFRPGPGPGTGTGTRNRQQRGSNDSSALHHNGSLEPKADDSSNQQTSKSSSIRTTAAPDFSSSKQKQTALLREESRAKRAMARSPRMFSKVDEEWNGGGGGGGGGGGSINEHLQQHDANQIDENNDQIDTKKKLPTAGDMSDRLISNSKPLSFANGEIVKGSQIRETQATNQTAADWDDRKEQIHHPKGWFMQVCSNFVRLLSGIRGSLNEARQLSVAENDFRDKQLEMLAGKIDNWYNSNTSTTNSVSPTTLPISQSSETMPSSKESSTISSKTSACNESAGLDQKDKFQVACDESSDERTNGEKFLEHGGIDTSVNLNGLASSQIINSNLEDEPEKEGTQDPDGQHEERGKNSVKRSLKEVPGRKLERTEQKLHAENKENLSKASNHQAQGIENASEEVTQLAGRAGKGDTTDKGESRAEQMRGEERAEKSVNDDSKKDTHSEIVVGGPHSMVDNKTDGDEKKNNNNNHEKHDNNVDNNDNINNTNTSSGGNNNNNIINNNIRFSSSNGGSSNGGGRGGGSHISRKDSAQSNQTIINKSDTSGDESFTGSVISNDNRDKTAAFERMELALVVK